jgi:hypothetical protein
MLMASNPRELKGRTPLRRCPDDFDVIFVEQGRIGCECWYRARRSTVTRWLEERGKEALIARRAAYVKHLRSEGQWFTRSSKLIEPHRVRPVQIRAAINDRREVNPTLARHAAQHLRIIRNGGFIVSPTPDGEWWVGSRRISAAQMLDLACAKGFDADVALQTRSG